MTPVASSLSPCPPQVFVTSLTSSPTRGSLAQACQRIAQGAHNQGAHGIEARSALAVISPSATSELAWWPGRQRATQVGGGVPFGQWRAPNVSDPSSLFPSTSSGSPRFIAPWLWSLQSESDPDPFRG